MRNLYFKTSVAILISAMIAIYWPGLHGAFFFDDWTSILITEGVHLETLTPDSIGQALASGYSGPSGRPVAQLSFALNHYFSGFDPFVFKATNLAIHLACGVLVFGLLLRLLAAARPQVEHRRIMMVSGVITAFWLLHPIQLLPVLHVVQRMTSLSAFFLLAALLLHILGRERRGRAGVAILALGWGMLWPLSVLSKETGLLFPFFVLLWELLIRSRTSVTLDRFGRNYAFLSALVVFSIITYLLTPFADWLWSGYEMRSFSLTERLLTEGRVLWFYLELIVFPRMETLGLYHDDIAVSTGLFSPWTTTTALLGLAGLIWLAWRARNQFPLVTFGIFWFLVGHMMESTILPLEIAHEHRNYLPILGVLLAEGSLLLSALESTGPRKTAVVSLTVAALAYFSFVTALRSNQFDDEGRRTQIEAQHHRLSARAQFEAGAALAVSPDASDVNSPIHAFARRHYELASQLDPGFKMSLLGLIQLNCRAGVPVIRSEIDELARRLRATPFAPADRNVLYNLKEMSIAGTMCLARTDIQKIFSAASSNPTVSIPVLAMIYSWYADYLLLQQKDIPAAKAVLAKSLRLVPANPSNRLKWAQLILLEGNRSEAAQLLKGLRDARLSASEKSTVAELLACLEENNARSEMPCRNINYIVGK